MYYVIETKYVGPNQYDTQFVDADNVTISKVPAKANMSGEPRTEGWCGTTNDWSVHAHGAYETLEAAQAAVAEKFGETRIQELGEYDEYENIVEKYKLGEYEPMSSEETADWAYEGIQSDITAGTTDERIDELVDEYELEANRKGYTLDSDLGDFMRDRRQALRDEMEDES